MKHRDYLVIIYIMQPCSPTIILSTENEISHKETVILRYPTISEWDILPEVYHFLLQYWFPGLPYSFGFQWLTLPHQALGSFLQIVQPKSALLKQFLRRSLCHCLINNTNSGQISSVQDLTLQTFFGTGYKNIYTEQLMWSKFGGWGWGGGWMLKAY